MVFVFGYLWAYCEAILPFVWLEGCAPNNGGKCTLLGSTYFVRAAVTCVMTSLKLFSFRSVENRLFSLLLPFLREDTICTSFLLSFASDMQHNISCFSL